MFFIISKNKESIQYILKLYKQKSFLSFMSTYCEICFPSQTVMNLMKLDLFTSTGTTDGMNPNQVSYREGYFHYECGNINLS